MYNNPQLAAELDLSRTAQTWRILQLLYGTPSAASRNLSILFGRQGTTSASQGTMRCSLVRFPWRELKFYPDNLSPHSKVLTPQAPISSAHSDTDLLTEIRTPKSDSWIESYRPSQPSSSLMTLSSSNAADTDDTNTDDDAGYTTDTSQSSESSFTYGLKVGAGRRALARFGIGRGRRAGPLASTLKTGKRGENDTKPDFAALHLEQDVVLPSWEPEQIVKDVVEYYAELVWLNKLGLCTPLDWLSLCYPLGQCADVCHDPFGAQGSYTGLGRERRAMVLVLYR